MKIKLTRLELFLKSAQPPRTAHFENFSYLRCRVKAISESLWHTKFKRIAVNKSGLNLWGVSTERQKMVPSFFFFYAIILPSFESSTMAQYHFPIIQQEENTKTQSTTVRALKLHPRLLLNSSTYHFTPNDGVFWMRSCSNLNYLVSIRVSFLVRQQDYAKTTERISRILGWRMSFSPFILGAEADKGTDPGNTCLLSLTSQGFPDVSTRFSARE